MDDVLLQDEELLTVLPATSEGEPEELPQDEENSTVALVESVDYTPYLIAVHSDLQQLSDIGNAILFTMLIAYFVPMIRSLVHKFLFREEKK